MEATAWLAALVFFLQLPILLYWLVFHPAIGYWRRHGKAVYFAALLLSWGPVTASLFLFHTQLLRPGWPRAWEIVLGLTLVFFEVWIFRRVEHGPGSTHGGTRRTSRRPRGSERRNSLTRAMPDCLSPWPVRSFSCGRISLGSRQDAGRFWS